VVRVLTTGATGLEIETDCARDFSITISVRPVVNKYPTLFRAGEGGEEEE